jgi:hypothetical protein
MPALAKACRLAGKPWAAGALRVLQQHESAAGKAAISNGSDIGAWSIPAAAAGLPTQQMLPQHLIPGMVVPQAEPPAGWDLQQQQEQEQEQHGPLQVQQGPWLEQQEQQEQQGQQQGLLLTQQQMAALLAAVKRQH